MRNIVIFLPVSMVLRINSISKQKIVYSRYFTSSTQKFIVIFQKMVLYIHNKYMVFFRQLVETRNQFLDIIYYIFSRP